MAFNMDEPSKQVLDVASVSVVVASILEWVPEATAILSLIWVALRIWESDTVQRFLGRKK